MPRLKGSADLLEDRRKRALALLDSGYSLNEVGRRIGCNPSSVMRWRNARQRGGAKALQVRFSPGRPLKLDRRQRRCLVNLLLQGPMMHGYRTKPLDDRPHCGIDPHPVRNPVPPRSPRTVDAPPAMESAETTRTRPGEG